MKLRKYIFSQRKFFLLSFLLYVSGIFLGFWGAKAFPEKALGILGILKSVYGEVGELSSHSQFFFLVVNNSITAFLVVLLSFFLGLFPLLVLLFNGGLMGALFFFLKGSLPFSLLLISVLPHGIFEIPVLIMVGGIGLRIAFKTINIILGRRDSLRKEFSLAFIFFFKVAIPLLVLAALIESYLVPYLIRNYT